jgi:hypothetical protein
MEDLFQLLTGTMIFKGGLIRVERREITLLNRKKLNNLLHKIKMDNE